MKLEKQAQALWKFLNLTNEPEKADVIFILGGSSLAPVEKAIELFRAGFAPRIAFISIGGTFGGEKVWGMPEHQKYRQEILAAGILPEAILSEGLTTNTLAEAIAAIPFIAQKGIDLKKMILVSRPVHQRRAFLTFARQHKQVRYINCPGNETFDPADLETQKRMVEEIGRIILYSGKGDILMDGGIPAEILAATQDIRSVLGLD
ncbi:MAG TPA: YdcF family protein [Candidatus Paceibacterota bacterium]|nr:YdcF family protein [Candidatus Paceibacterota bacterium]